jgi:hypothetical protein
LTQIADRLERTRLVKRVAEGNDRRVRCLQLTARGEKMTRSRREARVLRIQAVLEHLSAPQREAVRASLEVLANACSAVPSGPAVHRGAERAGGRNKTANGHVNKLSPRTSAENGPPSKVTP